MGREYAILPALLALSLAAGVPTASTPAWAATSAYSEAEIRSIETPDEVRVRELRNQEITQLRIALGRRLPNNRRADLYFRLAEIYLEAYRMEYLLEGRAHEKRVESGRQEKGIDHSRSRPYLKSGIAASREILRFGIPYPKLDQVYFFLGFNHGELGEEKESLRYFEQLVRKFPGSVFAAEAYQQMGDAAFDAGQFRKAQGHYEAATELAARKGAGDGAVLPRVLHKLAWCYYRIRQHDRAVETMKRAIAAARRSDEKFLSLREEALRDMAVFMTESGKVDEAVAYFQEAAGDKSFYPRLLEKLGRQYERGVEPAKATQVYESLLKTHPGSDAAFRVLVKLVDLDLRRGRHREALARLRDLRLKSGDDETQVASQNLRAMVRRTATEHHEKFRKAAGETGGSARSKALPALEIAEAFYEVYLATFLAQDDPRKETPEIQMYLAEVKRDLGKSKEASALYRKVVDSRDSRYAKEAGALWTASLAEAIRKEISQGQAQGKSQEPSELEREFISAADALRDAIGDTAEGREAALKAAEVLAGYKGTQKDAIKRVEKIIDRWPRSAQAVTAARLWLQLLSDRGAGALDELSDALKELRGNGVLLAADQEHGKGKLHAQLAELESRVRIATIASHEKEMDFAAAAKGYEEFARDAAQRELAEKAYANAIGSHLKAGDDEAVERVGQAWLKRFPKSPKAAESLRAAATQQLVAGRFDKAARLFERLGTEGGEADSLETSARIHEGLGNAGALTSALKAYLGTYQTPQRPQLALQLARALEAAGQDSEASRYYRLCMSGSGELETECGARLADLHLRSKSVAEAKALYRKVGKGGDSPWVGYARYMLASITEQEAAFQPLSLPEARLKKAMSQRLAFVETLSRAYNSAVEAGGPWAIAALDRLADWVLRFADEVDAIATPPQASPAAVAQFRKSLASVSLPLRRKALQTWQQAYAKSAAAEALSPALPGIADRLADFKVGGIGKAQGFRGRFRLAGIPANGGSEGGAALEKTRERLAKNLQDAGAWVDYGNLLWGQGKPLLSKLAYDRALALNARNPAALNNRAVVELSLADAEDDWSLAAGAYERFKSALRQDEFFLPAKFNRAALLNYYRIFAKAKPLWEQVLAKGANADAQEGLGIALQGLGKSEAAAEGFRKAAASGGSASRFVFAYHEAAREPESCQARLEELDAGSLSGFEKAAVERLRKTCSMRQPTSGKSR
ncbi:MAG: tetratricopeptide repeat protein [Oligoflexia bacterium]|nr:tetratricopeptide repeat protein [Oligoflexia bacterium]